ncbi:MAG: DUF559 domain-containing protein [Corynebacterium sp.]|uniref:DUF559 domain-containing protein n=1 Tax=Corynebacterium sp. TaxID=1720 RepID=UPI0026E01545|nr:DUF559 domain-containing protein [Corynebacterium sp.]MDO5668419.1 DUF559 domain-containing protein [Corynebacterium sp.]
MELESNQVVDSATLRGQGLSQRQIERLVLAGHLHRVEQGVFTTSRPGGKLLLRALAHRRPGLVFTGHTALQLRREGTITLPVQAITAVGHSGHSSSKLSLVRRKDIQHEMVAGFRVTSRAVAVADADGVTDAELIAYLEAEFSGKEGKEALAAEVAVMPRVPARFHRLVAHAAIGADSEAEREVARALIAEGLVIEQNYFLGHYYFDILIPHAKLIVEIDGYRFHNAESWESFVQDRWKANLATRHGYRVLRYSGSCVKHHLEPVVEQIVAVVEESPEQLVTERLPVWKWHHVFTRGPAWWGGD